MKKRFKNSCEKGSALVWIFIAVGLFAALGFTMAQSSRNSASNITEEQGRAIANEIISYGNAVKAAIKRLRLRGCSETEISFENPITSGYINGSAPSNKKCHVFDAAGGGLAWKTRNTAWNSTCGGFPLYLCNEISFDAATRFPGMGTDGLPSFGSVDLSMRILGVNKQICEAMHKIAGNPLPVPASGFNSGYFIGSYSAGVNYMMTVPSEKTFGCHTYSPTSPYNLYYVLLSR